MKLGRLKINARMVDHHWPPRWVGPWLGITLSPKPRQRRRASQMFDVHAQLHLRPQDHLNGIQTGIVIVLYHADEALISYGRNWWSPGYGRTGLGILKRSSRIERQA